MMYNIWPKVCGHLNVSPICDWVSHSKVITALQYSGKSFPQDLGTWQEAFFLFFCFHLVPRVLVSDWGDGPFPHKKTTLHWFLVAKSTHRFFPLQLLVDSVQTLQTLYTHFHKLQAARMWSMCWNVLVVWCMLDKQKDLWRFTYLNTKILYRLQSIMRCINHGSAPSLMFYGKRKKCLPSQEVQWVHCFTDRHIGFMLSTQLNYLALNLLLSSRRPWNFLSHGLI